MLNENQPSPSRFEKSAIEHRINAAHTETRTASNNDDQPSPPKQNARGAGIVSHVCLDHR